MEYGIRYVKQLGLITCVEEHQVVGKYIQHWKKKIVFDISDADPEEHPDPDKDP